MYYKEELQSLIQLFDEKQSEKLQLSYVIRAIEKLEEKGIEDSILEEKFLKLKDSLEKTKETFKGNKSIFIRDMKDLMEYLKKEHSLVAKGQHSMTYMMYGMSIGVAIGVALMSTGNSAFLAVGIGAGMAIGFGVGASIEKKAEEQGVIY